MSLRWRLSLALAVLAAAATAIAATTAYFATENRLSSEADSSLRQAAGELAHQGPPPGANSPGGPAGGNSPSGGGGPPGGGGENGSPSPPPPQGNLPPPRGGLLDFVVLQQISATGGVLYNSRETPLPVGSGDIAVASGGAGPFLHTVSVGGVPYRLITVSIPTGGAFQLARSTSDDRALLGSLRWRFGFLAAIVTLAAAGAGWLVARRITAPLEALAGSADEIAATGRLHLDPGTERGDEVGRLARAMSTMMGALARSRDQQRRLAQDAGHELRTPLTSIRTNLDVLARHDDLDAGSLRKIYADLDGELRELTGLVDELLELATDSRDAEPARDVHLGDVAARVAQRVSSRSGRMVEIETDDSVVHGREHALERAIANLVDNAVKFSRDGSPVRLVVGAGTVEVCDEGPGILPTDLPHIFDRFYRSSRARSEPGSGLGLSIVAQVAREHGGSVFARNLDTGGCVIGFEVPSVTG